MNKRRKRREHQARETAYFFKLTPNRRMKEFGFTGFIFPPRDYYLDVSHLMPDWILR